MSWLSPIKAVFDFGLPFLEGLPIIRALLAFALMFFLPGFTWTFVIFKQIDFLERIVLSLALSIAFVTLSLLLANALFGMRVTGFNSVLVIIVLTILPVVIYYLNRIIRSRKGGTA